MTRGTVVRAVGELHTSKHARAPSSEPFSEPPLLGLALRPSRPGPRRARLSWAERWAWLAKQRDGGGRCGAWQTAWAPSWAHGGLVALLLSLSGCPGGFAPTFHAAISDRCTVCCGGVAAGCPLPPPAKPQSSLFSDPPA